jgi:hypothetical protein
VLARLVVVGVAELAVVLAVVMVELAARLLKVVVVGLWSLADWTVKRVRAHRRTVAEHLAVEPVRGAS